jgi:flagellin-like protein
MKKIWKIRKDSEAVSPVIATILMVAITVVLAAVLYVMVMGFGGTSTQTPTGSFVGSPTNQTSGYQLQFGVISPSTTWNSCKFSLTVGGVATALSPAIITLNSGTSTVTVALGTIVAPAKTYTVIITDLAADGKISTGDYVVVTSTGGYAVGSYSLGLIFTSTGGQICTQSWTV